MSKLYTEEEIRKLLNEMLLLSSSVDDAINSLTPIELPTDEEIEEQSWGYRELTKDMEIPPNEDWSNGAKWMKDKIKGGNNE